MSRSPDNAAICHDIGLQALFYTIGQAFAKERPPVPYWPQILPRDPTFTAWDSIDPRVGDRLDHILQQRATLATCYCYPSKCLGQSCKVHTCRSITSRGGRWDAGGASGLRHPRCRARTDTPHCSKYLQSLTNAIPLNLLSRARVGIARPRHCARAQNVASWTMWTSS